MFSCFVSIAYGLASSSGRESQSVNLDFIILTSR
jgi:hypothetical protein